MKPLKFPLPKYRKAFYAFIIPFLLRAIIEIYSAPYTVGYDTVAEYVPTIGGFTSIFNYVIFEISSLYNGIAMSLQFVLQNPILTVKVLAILLVGFLGLTLYLWGTTFLSRKNALFFSLIASFYFSTLRITWDLHRNLLGLSLMFATIYVIESIHNNKLRLPFLFSWPF